jgi:hypothetical protein
MGLIVLAVNIIIRPQRDAGILRRYRYFMVVTVWSYIIPTLSPVKSFYLGGAFYGCFLSLTTVGIGDLVSWWQNRHPKRKWLPGVALLAIVLVQAHRPQFAMQFGPALASDLNNVAENVSAALVADVRRSGKKSPVVFVESPDPITDALLAFNVHLARLPMNPANGYYIESIEDAKSAANSSDYVFISEDRMYMNYPGDKLSAALLSWTLHNQDYSILSDYVDSAGHHSYLFRHL